MRIASLMTATTSPAVLQLRGDTGPSAGCTFVISQGVTVLGRDLACEIILTARNVSRRHACITCRQDHYFLEDLGSRAGTLLNDVRLADSVRLHDGDRIGIGGSTFTFTFAKTSSDDELKVAAESTILGVRDVSGTAERARVAIHSQEKFGALLETSRDLGGTLMSAPRTHRSPRGEPVPRNRASGLAPCAGAGTCPPHVLEPQTVWPTEVTLESPSDASGGAGALDSSSAIAPGPRVSIKPSRRFGRYRILRRLGRGSMGSVYLAHDTHLDRRVALKVPHFRNEGGSTGGEPNRLDLDRFYREARIAATFDHSNLCPVYDVGQQGGIHYLSMAYVKGRPLSDFISPARPMALQRVAAVVRKLALALEVAHARGIVHRDLKPSNIMVNSRRELIIMDFGLAWRLGSGGERLTKTGMVLGTPAYMSPEQLSGSAEVLGPRCDIYSLGVILYELLTGCRPFAGQEAVILGQILFIEPAPPSGHRPDLDARIEAICLKAMAKKPEDRYASMGELAAALGDYLRGNGTGNGTGNGAAAAPERRIVSETGAGAGAIVLAAVGHAPDAAGEPGVWTAAAGVPECSPEADAPIALYSPEPSTEPATLERLWRQWTAIVELFALRRSRRRVDWQAYHDLHRGLIEAARTRAAGADGTLRDFFRHLEDLALPWLTPKTLAQADREILFSLLLCCRRAEQELNRVPPVPGEPAAPSVSLRALVWGASAFLVLSIVAWFVSLIWTVI
jgi:pSer/pThr/pTyr-binding forkhead associated (FHA) protein